MRITDIRDVKSCINLASGYRGFQSALHQTDKAVRVAYYDWELWIPKSALRKNQGQLWAPLWAIETAKEHASKRAERLRYAAVANCRGSGERG